MLAKFSFTVEGKPIPKARPRLGRGRRAFTPQRTLDYEALVKEACVPNIPEGWPTEAEYEVDMVFFFADRTHGDLDNHAKMLDGLNPKVKRIKRKVVSRETPFVWVDDKQVRKLTIERFYVDENPRLEVTITAWEPTTTSRKPKSSRPKKPSRSTGTPSSPSTARPSKLLVKSGKAFSKHIETCPAPRSKKKISGPTG